MLKHAEFPIPQPQLTLADNAVQVDQLRITDPCVYDYLAALGESDRGAGLLNCISVGARAVSFASDRANVGLLTDTMKAAAESASTILEQVAKTTKESVGASTEAVPKHIHVELEKLRADLERTFDPQNAQSIIGRFRQALVADYRQLTQKAKEDLDLANPASPLSALRREIETKMEQKHEAADKKLTELLAQGAAKVAAAAERSKGTRKGGDLETALEDFVSAECRPRKDLCRRTATENGFDGNQVGDFVIEIDPAAAKGPGLRIVLESKNAHRSTASLIRELDKAMKNRGAAFGISVVNDPSAITAAIVPYGDDKLLVRVSLNANDEYDMLALCVALEMARWKSIMGRARNEQHMDLDRINAHVSSAINVLNRFAELKKKLTATKTQIDTIADYGEDIRRDLARELQALRQAVVEETVATITAA